MLIVTVVMGRETYGGVLNMTHIIRWSGEAVMRTAELDERLEVQLAQVELTLRQCADAIAERGMGYAVSTFGARFAGASVQIHALHVALIAELPACAASCIEKTRAGDDDEWEVKQLARRLERLVDGAEGEDDE